MTQNRNTVEVDVHVKVTLPGASQPGLSVTEKPETSGYITLTVPPFNSAGQYTAQVWTDASGKSYICAKGNLSALADCVAAEVYSASAHCPSTQPTTQDAGMRAAPVFVDGGGNNSWQFTRLGQPTTCAGNLLPLPSTPGSGGTTYQLEVWTQFSDGTTHSQTFSFVGIPANQTDCDNPMLPSRPASAAGCCGETQTVGQDNPSLVGVLREKTGRFAALPEHASFGWDAGQGGWVWAPPQARCGTFTLLPVKDGFVLHSTVADPANVCPAPGGRVRPLQLTFEATVPSGAGGKAERLVLEIREGDGG